LQDSKQGLQVTKLNQVPENPLFAEFDPELLRKGDILLSVDGQPTPSEEAYWALFNIEKKNPIAVAGDLVRLALLRDGKQMELPYVLGRGSPRPVGQSARCS